MRLVGASGERVAMLVAIGHDNTIALEVWAAAASPLALQFPPRHERAASEGEG